MTNSFMIWLDDEDNNASFPSFQKCLEYMRDNHPNSVFNDDTGSVFRDFEEDKNDEKVSEIEEFLHDGFEYEFKTNDGDYLTFVKN